MCCTNRKEFDRNQRRPKQRDWKAQWHKHNNILQVNTVLIKILGEM